MNSNELSRIGVQQKMNIQQFASSSTFGFDCLGVDCCMSYNRDEGITRKSVHPYPFLFAVTCDIFMHKIQIMYYSFMFLSEGLRIKVSYRDLLNSWANF